MLRELNAKIPGAPNFKYSEFIKSDTAIRLNISNIPSREDQWQNIERIATNVVQPVRNNFGSTRITSGYRTPYLCSLIGSSTTSNHTRGEAADIEPIRDDVRLIDVLEWVHDNCEFRELIAEYFPMGWIHIAFREGGNIRKVKLKDNKHHYSVVSLDYIKEIYK